MTFYDDNPFDFVSPGQEAGSYPALFSAFIAARCAHERVLDIGCGAGRNLAGLATRTHATGLDRSLRSAKRARRYAPTLCGDALAVGVRSRSADAVVLDGVAHHTPDPRRAIEEAARVLRDGGELYVAVYKPAGYYPFAYRRIGSLFRRLARSKSGRALLELVAVPVYGLLHRLRRGARSREAVRALFADYFLTPVASFHPREEIDAWASGAGLALETYDPYPEGNCHLFVFRKRA